MAKRKTQSKPAADVTPDGAKDVTPEGVDPAPTDAPAVDPAGLEAETGTDTAPAAPAASDPAAGDNPTATDPATSADPAAAPEPPQAAPPASADAEPPSGGGGAADATIGDLASTSQEVLDRRAEEKQPEPPRLDRVMARLAASMPQPFNGYASSSPEIRLHGDAIELNARLFEAMAAEGVPVRNQGDTLQFLLEELGASLKQF